MNIIKLSDKDEKFLEYRDTTWELLNCRKQVSNAYSNGISIKDLNNLKLKITALNERLEELEAEYRGL